jgi:hypothetical protein
VNPNTPADETYNPDDTDELIRRLGLIAKAFSPSAPITSRQLFSGRTAQMNRLMDIQAQRGQHALVYGERGVGKTSLAKVVAHPGGAGSVVSAFYTCNSGDTFGSIWRGVLTELVFTTRVEGFGFNGEASQAFSTAADHLPESPTPDDVRRTLTAMSRVSELGIYIDEFDRPIDPTTRALFADTVKILSDQAVPVTMVLIGVAKSVSELIAEHRSIERSLIQVQMPLMTHHESAEIVRQGMAAAEMTVDDGFVEQIIDISQGLPHYTHLISQHGARHCVEAGRLRVRAEDSGQAVSLALNDVSQSVRELYHRATSSNRDTIYEQVLLACARSRKDEIGEFGSAELRRPLKEITGRDYDIPAYSTHLNAFASPDGQRGGILEKKGTQARFRYRFIDPLMPPYVLMRGHSSGL